MLADRQVQAVYVATPHPAHEAQAMASIEAGKQAYKVYCDQMKYIHGVGWPGQPVLFPPRKNHTDYQGVEPQTLGEKVGKIKAVSWKAKGKINGVFNVIGKKP